MPEFSTRSIAARATPSMSISFCASSCVKSSRASDTGSTRRRVLPWNSPGIMSRRLTPISSTDDPAMTSNDGIERCMTSTSTVFASSLPARNCSRSFSRVADDCSRASCSSCESAPKPDPGVRRGRQQQIQQPFFCGLRGAAPDFFLALLAHHLHADLDEIAPSIPRRGPRSQPP